MPPMRGLLAPQNAFLDTIARRFDGTHSNFVLGNAQVPSAFPVVYCSDGFCDLTGFSRAEVMQRCCACSFLYGPATSELLRQQLRRALDEHQAFKGELILYRKSGVPFWCLLDVVPIKNEKDEVALFLVSHKDITSTKSRSGADSTKDTGGRRRRFSRAGGKGFNASRRRSRAVLYHLSGHLQRQRKSKHKLRKGVFGDKPSLPEYKVAAIRKPPLILLHYGAFKAGWDGLILLATLYVAVTVPYSVCVGAGSEEGLPAARGPPSACDLCVEILFMLDIVLNFRTTFVSKSGQVVLEPRAVARHYLAGWFPLDLVAALPFDLLAACQVNVYVGAHLLKTVRLLRLLRLLPNLDRYSQYSAVVLALLMVVFALLAHWVACGWFLLGQREVEGSPAALPEIGTAMGAAGGPGPCPHTPGPALVSPCVPVCRLPPLSRCQGLLLHPHSLAAPQKLSLTSVGFGNVSANTDTEKIFSICTMLVGALMHAVVFGNVTAIIQRLYARRFLYHSRTRDLHDYSRIHRIPRPLKRRILEYFQSTWAANNGIDTAELLQSLPEELRADIALHLHKELLQLPLFGGASRGCLRALSLGVRPAFCTPGELLIRRGDALQALYFLRSGSMEVLRDGTVLAILGKGDLIGCDLGGSPRRRRARADVRGLTYCALQSLGLPALAEGLALDPDFARAFRRQLPRQLSYDLGGTPEAEPRWPSGEPTPPLPAPEEGAEPQPPSPGPAPPSPRPPPAAGPQPRPPRSGAPRAPPEPGRPTALQLHPWSGPPDLSPRVVDGTEGEVCAADKPLFSFHLGPSLGPAGDGGLLAIPPAPPEPGSADTIEKLRQAVAELSGQVLQLREGLRALREAVQLLLLPPPPRPDAPAMAAALQPLRVETGGPGLCLHPPPPDCARSQPWGWGPPAARSPQPGLAGPRAPLGRPGGAGGAAGGEPGAPPAWPPIPASSGGHGLPVPQLEPPGSWEGPSLELALMGGSSQGPPRPQEEGTGM